MLSTAGRLGLLGSMPGQETSREGETAVARDLRLGLLHRARETWDVDRLDTALKWFDDFMRDSERDPTFVPLSHAGDLVAMGYNQETLEMFAEYIRRRGSRLKGRQGETIKSDTISTYVSQIKKLRTVEAHYSISGRPVHVQRLVQQAPPRAAQTGRPQGERQRRRQRRGQGQHVRQHERPRGSRSLRTQP